MSKKYTTIGAMLLLSAGSIAQDNTDVILQSFTWNSANWQGGWYNHINGKRSEIVAAGFDAIYLPPPSQSTDPWGYIPEQHSNFNSNYGSENELRTIISDMHNDGVNVVADIVLNHRNGSGSQCGFSNPSWDNWTIVSDDEAGCGTGNPDTGAGFDAGRDLDHSNATLRDWLTGWLNWVGQDNGGLGFDGWRWDYAKGFSGSYVGEYNVNTNAHYSIGEYFITEGFDSEDPTIHREGILDWIASTNNTSWAFDFTTRGAFIDAFKFGFERLAYQGAAPGVLGVNPGRAINFIDNHDTGANQQAHWPFDAENDNDIVPLGYAYILTHPGVPMVFWEQWEDPAYKSQINDLIALRKQTGINALSDLNILNAGSGYYAASIDDTLIISIGWNDANSYSPGAGWDLELDIESDDVGYKVWTKNGQVIGNQDPLEVHLWLPSEWSMANIHYWNVSPTIANSTWPGATMSDDGNGWFTYSFPAGTTTASFVFNENDGTSGAQTTDLTATQETWYYMIDQSDVNGQGHVATTESSTQPSHGDVTVGVQDFHLPSLIVYPNPANDFINVGFQGSFDVVVRDVMGKTITQSTASNLVKIGVADWPAGIYLVEVATNGVMDVRKVVVR